MECHQGTHDTLSRKRNMSGRTLAGNELSGSEVHCFSSYCHVPAVLHLSNDRTISQALILFSLPVGIRRMSSFTVAPDRMHAPLILFPNVKCLRICFLIILWRCRRIHFYRYPWKHFPNFCIMFSFHCWNPSTFNYLRHIRYFITKLEESNLR